jgi:hypothetical protein
MKKVKVNASQVALVFKNGGYKRILTTGTYWFWRGEAVYLYELTQPFIAPIELNILLRDEVLPDLLYFVEVEDNEIVLQYENGLLKQVLTAGRYPFWKTLTRHEFTRMRIKTKEVE